MSGVRLVEAGSAKVAIDLDVWKAVTRRPRIDRRYNTDMLGGAPLWRSHFDKDTLLQTGWMLVVKAKAPGIPTGYCGQVKWEQFETTPGGSPSAAATWDAAILARQCFRTVHYADEKSFSWLSLDDWRDWGYSWLPSSSTASKSLVVNSTPPPEYNDDKRYTLYVQAARRFAEAMGWKYCECPRKPPYNILQRLAGWIDACADNIDEAAFPEEFREWYNIAEDQFATKTCTARERAFRCFASRTHELTFALAGAGLCRLVFAWLLQAEPGRYLNSLLEGRRDMVGIHDSDCPTVITEVHETEVSKPRMVRAVDGSTSPAVTPPDPPSDSDPSNRRGKRDTSASEQCSATGTPGAVSPARRSSGERDADGGIMRNIGSGGNNRQRRRRCRRDPPPRRHYLTRRSLENAVHLRHGGDTFARAEHLTEYSVNASVDVVSQYTSCQGRDCPEDVYGIRNYDSWVRDLTWAQVDPEDANNMLVHATVDGGSLTFATTVLGACQIADACYAEHFNEEKWYNWQPAFDDETDLPLKYAGQQAVGLPSRKTPRYEGSKNRPYTHGTAAPDLVQLLVEKLEELEEEAEFYDLGAGRGYLVFVLRLLGFQRVGGCELVKAAADEANSIGRKFFGDGWCDVQHAAIGQIRFETRRPRLIYVNNEVFDNNDEEGAGKHPWLLRAIERMAIEDCEEGSKVLAVRPLPGCRRG